MFERPFGLRRLLAVARAPLAGIAVFVLALTAGEAAPRVQTGLRARADAELQAGLERSLAELGLENAVGDGRLAVALVDHSDTHEPRLAMVNGDEMMYAASLPKIAILLGAFVQAERGRLALDEANRASLHRMIRVSSNADASAMLDRVGREELLEILQSPRFALYDSEGHGGLWVGKPYGKEPAYRRDPLRGLSHAATAFQVARLYYLLDTDRLLSPELSRRMMETLSEPGIAHKLVKGLEARPGCRIYRKSGTWKEFHSDSVLVHFGRYRYVLVGLCRDPRGGSWLARMAPRLHDLVVPPAVSSSMSAPH